MGQIPSTLYGRPFDQYMSKKDECVGNSGDSYYDKLIGGVECNPVELSKTVIIKYLLSRYNPVTGEGLDCIYNQRPFVGIDDPNYNAEDQLNDSNYLQIFTSYLNAVCAVQEPITKIIIKTIPMGIEPFFLANSDGSVEFSNDGVTYTDNLEVVGGDTIYIKAAGADCADACGASAYEIWLAAGNTGTEQDFLDSLQGPAGEQGPPGTNANINGLTWKGNWTASPSSAYAVNDAVQSGGSSYVLINTGVGSPLTDPATDTSGRWDELALAGATGPAGADGADGAPGADGVDAATGVVAVRYASTSTDLQAASGNSDRGKLVILNSATSVNFNIPLDASTTHFGVNFQVSVMQAGNGQVQITAPTGVTLISANNMRHLRTKNSACTIMRVDKNPETGVAVTNTYLIFGDLTNVTY